MNILLVTNMYPSAKNVYYGIFVREYAQSLQNAGHTVTVFFTDGSVHRSKYVTRIPKLVSLLRSGAFDIVHAQHTFCCYQIALARPFVSAMPPVVLTLHEGEILRPRDYDVGSEGGGSYLVYSHRMKLGGLNIADRVVSVERHLPLGVGYRRKFNVIPPAVDIELFVPMQKEECRRRLGLPVDEKIVFFPANPQLYVPKGVDLFRAALALMSRPVHVVYGGAIAHAEMPLYMNAADVVIQASKYEASPMVIKEAMACNVPIVATDTGDARFIIGDTEGCYVCDRDPHKFAEAINAALDGNVRTRGRERVLSLKLVKDQVLQQYEDIYNELLAERHLPQRPAIRSGQGMIEDICVV